MKQKNYNKGNKEGKKIDEKLGFKLKLASATQWTFYEYIRLLFELEAFSEATLTLTSRKTDFYKFLRKNLLSQPNCNWARLITSSRCLIWKKFAVKKCENFEQAPLSHELSCKLKCFNKTLIFWISLSKFYLLFPKNIKYKNFRYLNHVRFVFKRCSRINEKDSKLIIFSNKLKARILKVKVSSTKFFLRRICGEQFIFTVSQSELS